MKTWKEEKAKALERYIVNEFKSNGITVEVRTGRKCDYRVVIRNNAMGINYNECMMKAEREIDAVIQEATRAVTEKKRAVMETWGKQLDTTFLMNPLDFDDLARMYVGDRNEQALIICWLNDAGRLEDTEQYREMVYNDYMDYIYCYC